ncbi:MAG: SRPBCC family protein [Flavobacteriales bacterium]
MRTVTTYSRTILIHAPREAVFHYIDDIAHTGMHMTGRSMMMMGSKLLLERLSPEATGPNARYRWHGRMMGIPMDFSIAVTKWVADREKCWETTGTPWMIILSWYRMMFHLEDEGSGTRATLSIDYSLPNQWFWNLMARVLAPWYAKWCLKNMLEDCRAALEQPTPTSAI